MGAGEDDAVAQITDVLGPLSPEERGRVIERVLFLARGGVRYDFTKGDFPEVTFHEAELPSTLAAAPRLRRGRDTVSGPQRWRKKPVEVEALRYDGPAWVPGSQRHNHEGFREARTFCQGHLVTVQVGTVTHGGPNQFSPAIRTLEGFMVVSPGDYIIRGVKGEFYPCKPDIFAATYEPVRGGETSG